MEVELIDREMEGVIFLTIVAMTWYFLRNRILHF